MADYIPDFFLEQYALGELEGQKREIIDNSPEYQEKIRQIKKSDGEILNLYPPSTFVRSFQEFSAGKKKKPRIVEFAVKARIPLIAAASIALFFAILPLTIHRSQESTTSIKEMTRVKGMKPTLHVYRQKNGDPEILEDQSVVKENDRLQISYIASGRKFGAIFSIDGRGTVTLHFPETESAPPLLDLEGEIALPYSYELDDAPSFEKFIFVTSESEFSVSELLSKVRSSVRKADTKESATPELPDTFEKTTIYLRKGE